MSALNHKAQTMMAGLRMRSATICLAIFLAFGSNAWAKGTEFPLLMPKVHPEVKESYLCTPIRIDEDTR